MNKFIVLGLLVSASVAHADSKQIGAVDTVVLNKKLATVILSDSADVRVGSKVEIGFTDGVTCESDVRAVSGKKAQIDLSDCDRFKDVRKGQAVTLSDFQNDEVKAPTKPTSAQANQNNEPIEPLSKRIKIAVGIIGTGASDLEFSEAKFTNLGSQNNGELRYEAGGAFGLIAEALYAKPHRAGFGVGVMIETPRVIKNGTAKADSGPTYTPTPSTAETKLQMTSVHANFIYRFDVPYFYIGFNLASANITDAPQALSDLDGGFGGQLGIGFIVSDHFAFDLGVRSMGVQGNRVSDGAFVVEPGLGSVGGWNATLKYIF